MNIFESEIKNLTRARFEPVTTGALAQCSTNRAIQLLVEGHPTLCF